MLTRSKAAKAASLGHLKITTAEDGSQVIDVEPGIAGVAQKEDAEKDGDKTSSQVMPTRPKSNNALRIGNVRTPEAKDVCQIEDKEPGITEVTQKADVENYTNMTGSRVMPTMSKAPKAARLGYLKTTAGKEVSQIGDKEPGITRAKQNADVENETSKKGSQATPTRSKPTKTVRMGHVKTATTKDVCQIGGKEPGITEVTRKADVENDTNKTGSQVMPRRSKPTKAVRIGHVKATSAKDVSQIVDIEPEAGEVVHKTGVEDDSNKTGSQVMMTRPKTAKATRLEHLKTTKAGRSCQAVEKEPGVDEAAQRVDVENDANMTGSQVTPTRSKADKAAKLGHLKTAEAKEVCQIIGKEPRITKVAQTADAEKDANLTGSPGKMMRSKAAKATRLGHLKTTTAKDGTQIIDLESGATEVAQKVDEENKYDRYPSTNMTGSQVNMTRPKTAKAGRLGHLKTTTAKDSSQTVDVEPRVTKVVREADVGNDTTMTGSQGRMTRSKAAKAAGLGHLKTTTATSKESPNKKDSNMIGCPVLVTIVKGRKQGKLYSVLAGNGLIEGTTGKPVIFKLHRRKVDGGQPTCRCTSAEGVNTDVLISDNKDGTFTIDVDAKEPGLHSVDLEWDSRPVPGSPFMVHISQAIDAEKVKADGPGLKSGILGGYEGWFTVDTKGAGLGALKVYIDGPKGAFNVQMFRKRDEVRTIGVFYNPIEAGFYTVHLLWSDKPIQGSPFQVCIADNEHQLARMLESQRLIVSDENDGQRINASMY